MFFVFMFFKVVATCFLQVLILRVFTTYGIVLMLLICFEKSNVKTLAPTFL